MQRHESLEQALRDLKSWAAALKISVDDAIPQIKEAMDAAVLPENCPSRSSLAEAILREPKKKFREVEAALIDVERALAYEDVPSPAVSGS